MILLNNLPINNAPVNKNLFEYGNEIIWRDGKFIELITLYKLINQLKQENTLYNDLLIIDRLCFKNIFLMFFACFIIKKTDIRVYSTISLLEFLPHTTIDIIPLEDNNEKV
jgi:hypothetical protein